jgi:flavin reductase ActVB
VRVAFRLAVVSQVLQLESRTPAPPPELTTGAFTDAMAELVSSVCVVTARGPDGEPQGLVATSLCSYSSDPPAVLVCVGRDGRARAAVALAHTFGVHILGEDQQDVARRFCTPGADKFAAVDWHWDDHVPALTPGRVVAYLRCIQAAVMAHGDHIAVIGEVEHVETAPRDPLVYLRRRMGWRLQHNGSA